MKRAFTLLELLIVIVIMTSLMTMIYRLTGIAGSANGASTTVATMQRLENALSGYLAAFGSYPPVKVQGSRDIYRKVTEGGTYYSEPDEMFNRHWRPAHQMILQVKTACMSQPVQCDFPYEPEDDIQVDETSSMIQKKLEQGVYDADIKRFRKELGDSLTELYLQAARNGFDALDGGAGLGRFNKKVKGVDGVEASLFDKEDWKDVQVFRFGLLSFLLPRYLFMCKSTSLGEADVLGKFRQWTANNALPARYWLDGTPYPNWNDFLADLGSIPEGTDENKWHIEMIPSQSVCQRWIANLSPIVAGAHRSFYGVEVGGMMNSLLIEKWSDVYDIAISPGGGETGSVEDLYVLDSYKVVDGWGSPLYYYSPPPYMSYRLWSGGPGGPAAEDARREGATFPPWMSLTDLDKPDDDGVSPEEQRRIAGAWMSDDIIHLSH